jgi:hypothetical protein
MALLAWLIVAWAVVLPAMVLGVFIAPARRQRRPLAPPEDAHVVSRRPVCEIRRHRAVVADSRRFLRNHDG